MKTFNDFFSDKGFFKCFSEIDSAKLSALIGTYTPENITMLDNFLNSQIGSCYIAPLLISINNTDIVNKTEYATQQFIFFKYKDLLSIKNALDTELQVTNNKIKTEVKENNSTSTNSVSSFNSDELSDDNKTNFINHSNNTITENNTETETLIKNINLINQFHKKNILSVMIDFIKDFYTLQII